MVSLPPAIFIDRVMRASVGDDEFLGYGALAVLPRDRPTRLQFKIESNETGAAFMT